MPTQIDCPECGGRGEIITADRSTYPPTEDFSDCFNPECKDGKITVYTADDLKKAVEDEREAILRKINYYGTIGCSAAQLKNYMIKAIRSREVSFEKSDH
ncbi:hypothetical protein KAR91_69815 [Candidatus Pacearchaeota archaeon]|nr:hypothetical protein [Candidatus Pacearchaeota archaeon]